MVSRNLLQRIKRLEAVCQPRSEPEMKPADAEVIRRLYAARRRKAQMGCEGYEALAPGGEPEPQPESEWDQIVENLKSARTNPERFRSEIGRTPAVLCLPSPPSPDIP